MGALVLGLLNAFVRPVLLFLTLPFNILTLGLFTIFLNAAIFFSAGYIIPSLMIKNYTWADRRLACLLRLQHALQLDPSRTPRI